MPTTKKVISYSLFLKNDLRNDAKYLVGLIDVIRTRKDFFPDWTIYIVYDKSIYSSQFYRDIKAIFDNTELLTPQLISGLESYPTYVKAGYRFVVMQDPGIDVALFRDLDSPLTSKDAAYVDQWMNEEKSHLLTYTGSVYPLSRLKKCNLDKYITSHYDDKVIEKPQFPLTLPAGGTAIHLQRMRASQLTLISYHDYVKRNYQKSDLNPQAWRFDEEYLEAHFLIPTCQLTKYNMFSISYGNLRGKWYDQKDFAFSPQLMGQLKQTEPLLEFVPITKINARFVKDTLSANTRAIEAEKTGKKRSYETVVTLFKSKEKHKRIKSAAEDSQDAEEKSVTTSTSRKVSPGVRAGQ